MMQSRDLTLAQAFGKLNNLELIVIKLSKVAPNDYEFKRDAIMLREKILQLLTIIITGIFSNQELGQLYDEQKSYVVNWKNKLKSIDPEVIFKLCSSTKIRQNSVNRKPSLEAPQKRKLSVEKELTVGVSNQKCRPKEALINVSKDANLKVNINISLGDAKDSHSLQQVSLTNLNATSGENEVVGINDESEDHSLEIRKAMVELEELINFLTKKEATYGEENVARVDSHSLEATLLTDVEATSDENDAVIVINSRKPIASTNATSVEDAATKTELSRLSSNFKDGVEELDRHLNNLVALASKNTVDVVEEPEDVDMDEVSKKLIEVLSSLTKVLDENAKVDSKDLRSRKRPGRRHFKCCIL